MHQFLQTYAAQIALCEQLMTGRERKQARVEQWRRNEVDRGGAIAAHPDAQIADPANGKTGSGRREFGNRCIGQRQLKDAGIFDLLSFQCIGTKSADRVGEPLANSGLTAERSRR